MHKQVAMRCKGSSSVATRSGAAGQALPCLPARRAAPCPRLLLSSSSVGRPRPVVAARAESGDAGAPAKLTLEDAYKVLGVSAAASFDEVLTAKNRQLAQNDGNMDHLMKIEEAYDMLFMQSMKKRLTGELEVSTRVRYADVPAPKKSSSAQKSAGGGSSVLQKLPGGVAVRAPGKQALATQSAVFSGLALWSAVQVVLEPAEAQLADTAGLQMALALGYSIYTFKETKRMDIGKSVGLAFACLVAGALLGSAIQNWVRVDIVPIGSFGSPGVFVTEVILVAVALGTLFLV